MNPLALLFLTVLIVVFYIVASSKSRVDIIEDAQTLVFPFALLGFWYLPARPQRMFPPIVVALLLFTWLACALHVRGYLPFTVSNSEIFLTRLSEDTSGRVGRDFFQNYNQYASTRDSSSIFFLPRHFSSTAENRRWLESHPTAAVLLTGDAHWLHLATLGTRIAEIANAPQTFAQLSNRDFPELSQFNIKLPEDAYPVTLPGTASQILVATSVDHLSFPTVPRELAEEFLATIIDGLGTARFTEYDREVRNAHRQLALVNAGKIDGAWKTNAPRALAYFLASAVDFTKLSNPENSGAANLDCAAENLFRADDLVQRNFAPELAAVILNNIGAWYSLHANKYRDYEKARKLFADAASVSGSNGTVPLGARLGLLNLIILSRNGFPES